MVLSTYFYILYYHRYINEFRLNKKKKKNYVINTNYKYIISHRSVSFYCFNTLV